MDPFRWQPGFGPGQVPRRTIGQLWSSLMPRETAIHAPVPLQGLAGWKRTWSQVQQLANSLELRDTIGEFMLMIVNAPAREGRRIPEFNNLLKEAADRGMPLIMVPSIDLLEEVLTVESYAEGAAILFASREELAERSRVMLKGTVSQAFAPAARETLEQVQPIAVEAAVLFENGHYVGAQATATVVLDTLLAKVLGEHMYSLGWKQTSITRLLGIIGSSSPDHPDRALALSLIIPPAIQVFRTANTDMDEYNRHATIHRVSPRQYTSENALMALMHMSSIFVLLRCVGPGGLPPGPTQVG